MEPEGPAEHRVAVVGALMPFFRDWLADRYAAASVADIPDPAAVAVAVVGPGPTIGATEMDALPGLEAITVYGVGYDNVDVAEAARRGIVVSHTPDVLDDAVADLTVALVLDVLRGVTAADRFVRSGKWAAGERFPLTREVGRTRVGILGLGRIGSATAERLSALGAVITYHSRSPKDVPWAYAATPVDLARLSDVVVVLTPGGDGTRHLVNRDVLDALGPDGFLVNVARGSVVDEDALVEALAEHRIAGAGLDVFADEPHVPERLLTLDNVVLTPHIASATVATREAMARLVMDNIDAHLAGRPLVTPVPEMGRA
ncbi:D-isomer specific 2-hydroxyacid dehydrogenase,NAD-binding [Phycicoccus elongatus Lp2]|uniref:D-isomer specific 2-hydroxyacid dehydrogenase,NAD-binding n=1 Tax=Phycicoccus elongatus Lp2 TaxID=1193181 RepID=N0E0D8_9MICO|nr:2-hydroxyacid dehydrogenase [Phycicoccus elongatus]CCH69191.1 D-isomer specific 2-hydroxyacid dehydrogenase,NAD-binding [Phycicoccus elongatus Lp2]